MYPKNIDQVCKKNYHKYTHYFITPMKISLLSQVVHILTYLVPWGWLACSAGDPCPTDTNMNNDR